MTLVPAQDARRLCRRCGESIRAMNLQDGFCPDCVREMADDD